MLPPPLVAGVFFAVSFLVLATLLLFLLPFHLCLSPSSYSLVPAMKTTHRTEKRVS